MTTQTVRGEWQPKSTLNSIEWTSGTEWRRVALLLIAGVAATALHARFNLPLKMPGHHGLEWMAILIFARCASRYRWAALIVAVGAAASSAVPVWGFKEPGFSYVLAYLVQGLTLDLLYAGAGRSRQWAFALAIFAAVAYATKPFVHWLLLHSIGGHYGSVVNGLGYPAASHLLFGLTGGLTGALLWKATQRYRAEDG